MELKSRIIQVLEAEPGLLGREIADRIGVDKKQVNSLLYAELKSVLSQDNQYRWYTQQQAPAADSTAETRYADTVLARLVRYYLACMGQDERGVSVFAQNKYGKPDYAELPILPTQGDLFQLSEVRDVLNRWRTDKGRMEVFFGYPSVIRPHHAKSGWRGFFVEPLFLFPIEADNGPGVQPSLQPGFPILNHKALEFLTQAQREGLMEELVQLEEELGLTGESEPPLLDEMALRLQSIRPEWPWAEDIDPDQPIVQPPLTEAQQGGLYNRAVVILAERSPFTMGLEAELRQLAQLPAENYSFTALGEWLENTVERNTTQEDRTLLEVLPLNTEQRQAIQQALSNKLTIVTGPPGTGKSQVVTNLLINAAWQGKRVLFASKNNKAVDVVETRVNSLGQRPVLLRVGAQQYQTRLAEYLLSMLSTTATVEDHDNHEEALVAHHRIEEKLDRLETETQRLIQLRNKVDALEQGAEPARELFSPQHLRSVAKIDRESIGTATVKLYRAINAASRERQPLLNRLLWGVKRAKRMAALNSAISELPKEIQSLNLAAPETVTHEGELDEIAAFHREMVERMELADHATEYFDALESLQTLKSLEEISQERSSWINRLSENALALWQSWLVTQPAKLTKEDRQKLNRYHSLLKMVMDTGPDNRLSQEVGRQYRALFKQAAHLLPCWATTALSARGKIPFEPGFFDLVVFDEASQCDIASALPLLYRAKQAVVIGDPKQLSHISGLPRGQDQQLLEKHGLLADHANWAYSYNSLFDLAAGLANASDIVNLRDHHRSHSDIIEFSNREFYENRLRVATRYDKLVRPNKAGPGVRWVHVSGQTRKPGGSGAENRAEAEKVVEALAELVLTRAYQGSIGVVAPFRAQANLVRKLVNSHQALSDALIRSDFLVDTVHRFQGDERDLMIFSPVIAEGMPQGALAFLRSNPKLFNVAITRARAMLIVVGDLNACSQCDVGYLERFANYSKALQEQTEREVQSTQLELGPHYPVVSNPERVSDWERYFYQALYQAGIRPIPQYSVEKYDLDFAVFDGDRKLNIEIDGERYHRNWSGELCRRDQLRNQRLIELGWDIRRFWVYEIRDDLERCIKQIKEWHGDNA